MKIGWGGEQGVGSREWGVEKAHMKFIAFVPDERGAARLLTNLVLACLIVLILLSTVVMDQNRVRTAVAMKRVEAIHKGIIEWQDEMIDRGHKPADGPPVPDSPNDLAPGHPEAAKLLLNGDDDYQYSFAGLRYERGQVYPLVSATARDPHRVIAEEIISKPDGTATVSRMSEKGRRISLLGFSRENPALAGAIVLCAGVYLGLRLFRRGGQRA
jgi:hypothetical protein